MAGAITNARILTPDEAFEPGTIVFDDEGRIAAVGTHFEPPSGVEVSDAGSLTLVPGYIDIHVHGGGGYSLATDDPGDIRSYARWVVSRGVTSFLPTICAPSIEQSVEFVRTAAALTGAVEGGANVLGVNLEGPFVNPRRRGALPPGWPVPPAVPQFERLAEAAGGRLRLITLAPEVSKAEEILTTAVARGVTVSVGHSDADRHAASAAFTAGASHVTHLFNGMRPFHHRDPGIIAAAFDDPKITVELIGDGVHLDERTVGMTLRLIGPERVALITDGVPPAGVGGTFRLGEEEATVAGNRVVLPGGTIAGGAQTMDHIVRNVVRWQAAGLDDAVRMASTVPARVIGSSERKGRIAPGYDADIIGLDRGLSVAMTWVGGGLVYVRA